MAVQSSILAWEIPWTEEPGGPQSLGSKKKLENFFLSFLYIFPFLSIVLEFYASYLDV